jgi:protein gp37
MATKTPIEWSEISWNPIAGCSIVSPGCTNCYAMRQAARIEAMGGAPHYAGLTREVNGKPVWTGQIGIASDRALVEPLRMRKPRRIFVNSMSDLFHESVPDEVIDRVFAVMALAHQHTFQVLTKRPERMRSYTTSAMSPEDRLRLGMALHRASGAGHAYKGYDAPNGTLWLEAPWPLPNVWLGVSIEDQRRADERVSILLDTPAAVRWVSAEPLLGPIDLTRIALPLIGNNKAGFTIDAMSCSSIGWKTHYPFDGAPADYPMDPPFERGLDWVVAGGESGPGARPMHPDWARSLRDQCAAAGVPFLFKQWGAWFPVLDRDNEDPDWRANYGMHERAGNQILNLAGGTGFHGDRVHVMRRQSKKRSGRHLDGVLHDAYPEVPRG